MLVSICLLIVSFDLQKGAQFCENTVEHGTVFKGTSGIRQRHFLIGRMECVQLFQQSCAVIFRVVLVGNIGEQPGEGLRLCRDRGQLLNLVIDFPEHQTLFLPHGDIVSEGDFILPGVVLEKLFNFPVQLLRACICTAKAGICIGTMVCLQQLSGHSL